jgi:hypothetical protein
LTSTWNRTCITTDQDAKQIPWKSLKGESQPILAVLQNTMCFGEGNSSVFKQQPLLVIGWARELERRTFHAEELS